MSSQNSNEGINALTKGKFVINAFQTACLAIITYLAIFVGDLLHKVITMPSFPLDLFIALIFVSAWDFPELLNNWASIKYYFKDYYSLLFLTDVATLGTFFWQIYLFSKLINDKKFVCDGLQYKALLVIACSYGCIFFLYALWSCFLLIKDKNRSIKDKKKEYIYPATVRIVLAIASFGSIVVGVDRVPLWLFIAFVLFCGGFTICRNQNLKIFDAIMNP